MKKVVSILKNISAKIYWCSCRNLPLLDENLCKCTVLKVYATPPSDLRPAIGKDYKRVWNLISNYFKTTSIDFVPKRKITLLNKIQYPDLAEEIIVDGQVIGQRVYDLEYGVWRFKPLYITVNEMIRKRVGFYAITSLPRISRLYEIHTNKIREANLPERSSREYIAISSSNGEYLGIGRLNERGRIIVLKAWRRKPYSFLEKDPSLFDAVKANIKHLDRIEREALEFIKKTVKEIRLPVVVSFSGGKDSLVTYYLVKKAIGPVPILFNNTGIEFPQTIKYVEDFASREGIDLIIADAPRVFWKGANILGPPARDYRWCCKVAKLAPLARKIKDVFPSGLLSFVGQRKFESATRATSPRIWKNRWLPKVIAASPIQNWSALDIWLYIIWRKLIPSPLYYEGFDRLGCWLCPASEMGEFELVKNVIPYQWSRWEYFLKYFSSKHNYPVQWTKLGLWRWLSLPGHIRKILRKNVYEMYNEKRGVDLNIKNEEDSRKIRVEIASNPISLSLKKLGLLLPIYGDFSYADNYIVLKNDAIIKITRSKDKNEIEIIGWKKDKLDSFLKTIIRAFYCIECLSCSNWCPQDAIELDREHGGIKILREKCISCGKCNDVCPIAEYALIAIRKKGGSKTFQVLFDR